MAFRGESYRLCFLRSRVRDSRPSTIAKNVVYVDSIKLTISAADYLRRALVDKGFEPSVTNETVVVYQSSVCDADKEDICSVSQT